MVRILFFIETLEGGGAEKVLRDLVNNMDQTKFDITVQTVWPCDSAKYLVPGIHYRSMYSVRNRSSVLRYRAEASARLSYPLHIRDNYDIECAYLEAGTTKIMAGSTNRRAKKLAWVHCDLQKAMQDSKSFAEKSSKYYAKFDKIVCVSQTVKEQFDKLFHNQFDSTILYNVINDAMIREKALLPLPGGAKKRRFTVLSVGRFSPQKNFIRLLKAHKRLLDEGLQHDLWILGDGQERPLLKQFIAENKLGDSVWMPGFVENPYPFMREADILACSSDFEGYSTFLTEGVILGRPIVTTDVSGVHELLGESEYGLITQPEDLAFESGLRRMMQDPLLQAHYTVQSAQRGGTFRLRNRIEETQVFFMRMLK